MAGVIRAVVGAPCDGPVCEIVVPDLPTGAHTLRFVITDASGTTERAIIQDLHPWWGAVAQSTADYPLPLLHLFSDRVSSGAPILWLGGPVQPVPTVTLDHSDSIGRARGRITATGSPSGLSPFGTTGLAAWSPVHPWADGTELLLGASSLGYDARDIGRDILARGLSGQGMGGTQSLLADGGFEYPVPVTVDLGLPDDNPPAVTWVTPALVSEDDSPALWSDVWLRVEDHDQDLDPLRSPSTTSASTAAPFRSRRITPIRLSRFGPRATTDGSCAVFRFRCPAPSSPTSC